MSNKKTLEQMSKTEAMRAGITSLADRPNDKSRYGDGGLTSAMLKERFDALPNLVRDRFNSIAAMLASTDAAKYITLGGEDNALGETLFDFLALFGPRGDGITDKNISDLIETLYQGEGDEGASSRTLKDIVASICERLVDLRNFAGGAVGTFNLWVDEEGQMVVDAIDLTGNAFMLYAIDPIGKAGIRDGAVSFEKLDTELGGRVNRAFAKTDKSFKTAMLAGDDTLVFETHDGSVSTVDLSTVALDGQTRDTIARLEKNDADHERRISLIEEHISDDYFVTDDSVAYEKAVPARACSSAKLLSLGGMTHKCKNRLDSTKINFTGNATVTNGVVTQTKADTNASPYMKCLTFDENDFVAQMVGGTIQIGRLGVAFEKTSETTSIRFGLNGSTVDTMVGTDVTHLPNGTYYLSVNFTNITQGSISWKDMMINEGSTALPYEPYYEGLRDSKVTEIKNHGANLWQSKNETFTVGGVLVTCENGVYTFNGTATSSALYTVGTLSLKDGSYSISSNSSKYYGTNTPVCQVYSSSTTIQVTAWDSEESHTTTTAVVGADNYAMRVRVEAGITYDNFVIKPMLVKGDTAVEYKPYREPISYPIPAKIQAINGYGKDGFNIDLEKQEYTYDGVTSALPARLEPIIKVEGGGSLEFVNEYKNPVPSAVKYLLKEESAV